MPPKRKAATNASSIIAPRRTLRDTFTSVSKASAALSGKNVLEKKAGNVIGEIQSTASMTTCTTTIDATATGRKRRRLDPVIVQNGDEDAVLIPGAIEKEDNAVEKVPEERAKRTRTEPRAMATKGRKKTATGVKATSKTPTVKDFFIPKTSAKSIPVTEIAETAIVTDANNADTSTPIGDTDNSEAPEDDPESLSFLPRFHRALITAVYLHYGTSNVAPLLSALTPSIANMAQRALPESTLLRIVHLSPYLRLESPPLKIHLLRPSPALEAQCTEFQTALEPYTTLTSIPTAKIEAAEDLAAPLRQRGKAIAATLKGTPKKTSSTPGGEQKTLLQSGMKVSSRASSLLERIKQKQALAATAPTAEEQATMLAEARVPEVMEILRAMRRKGESRGLKEVVEDVKGSLKRPISGSEAEEAVRILARREEWVNVKEVGGVQAVVFKREVKVNRFI
ncbi:hypothetical protein EX30DRAFT_362253 [Ascodesmis nigricans]|uniref:DNA replication factor Cdt1 C-terminal domain-containing protein n=1 Tax=Ascodesmis nigricans TaxID=341454 RepID=A0A4V3SJJ7_9PEZI|nr:hypothetical protein EX30DRAFT_362253 [Ascodesmis nigricans]